MTDTDDDLAARLRPTLTAYYDAPGPTDVARLMDAYPGGAGRFLADIDEAARRWLTSRPVSAADSTPAPSGKIASP